VGEESLFGGMRLGRGGEEEKAPDRWGRVCPQTTQDLEAWPLWSPFVKFRPVKIM